MSLHNHNQHFNFYKQQNEITIKTRMEDWMGIQFKFSRWAKVDEDD